MEIDTKSVIAHLAGMSAAPDNKLSQSTLFEMRPERIGHRLLLLRKALDLKPSEIADQLGIQRTYWSRFERGNRSLTDGFAALLVERYGVTLDFLILGRWDKLPADLAQEMREAEAEYRSSRD